MSIEKKLFPNAGKLIKRDEVIETTIVDAVIKYKDGAVFIDTKDYNHIYLSESNLLEMIGLIQKAAIFED